MIHPLFQVDGYKLDHRRQYPSGTSRVYSNWTPRQSRIPGVDYIIFFGLQYFLQKYLKNEMYQYFFNRNRGAVIDEYREMLLDYIGPNQIGVDHIEALHKLGYLPLEFRALPEGTKCPIRIPCVSVESTDKDFFWLTNYIETMMSNVMWMPCTSATTSHHLKRMLMSAATRSGGDPGFVSWQGHDFSYRGMAGREAAQLSGAGHLINFTGTDTIPAIDFIKRFYPNRPIPGKGMPLIGGSVYATEHSVMCAGGQEGELETFTRLLDLYPTGIVSVVSDTWDLWNVLVNILPQLKERILAREGKLVIRPDSGDPVKIICGDPDATGPANKGVIELLWNLFGGTTTSTGHRLLDSHIGAIYGDSINYDRAKAITDGLCQKGFASTNIVLGVGSYTYQYVTRDTFGWAMKATWAEVNNEPRNLFKKPLTDDGTKFSARGRLAVIQQDNTLKLLQEATPEQEKQSLLVPVWRNSEFLVTQSFDQIRKIAQSSV